MSKNIGQNFTSKHSKSYATDQNVEKAMERVQQAVDSATKIMGSSEGGIVRYLVLQCPISDRKIPVVLLSSIPEWMTLEIATMGHPVLS